MPGLKTSSCMYVVNVPTAPSPTPPHSRALSLCQTHPHPSTLPTLNHLHLHKFNRRMWCPRRPRTSSSCVSPASLHSATRAAPSTASYRTSWCEGGGRETDSVAGLLHEKGSWRGYSLGRKKLLLVCVCVSLGKTRIRRPSFMFCCTNCHHNLSCPMCPAAVNTLPFLAVPRRRLYCR